MEFPPGGGACGTVSTWWCLCLWSRGSKILQTQQQLARACCYCLRSLPVYCCYYSSITKRLRKPPDDFQLDSYIFHSCRKPSFRSLKVGHHTYFKICSNSYPVSLLLVWKNKAVAFADAGLLLLMLYCCCWCYIGQNRIVSCVAVSHLEFISVIGVLVYWLLLSGSQKSSHASEFKKSRNQRMH